mmetsp:Transcript_49721/g.75103  ORF Transcript_49721/g.75103 Transcript_49721/m.75103 type:complete len:182 (+) Transcript_49721:121-666(+)
MEDRVVGKRCANCISSIVATRKRSDRVPFFTCIGMEGISVNIFVEWKMYKVESIVKMTWKYGWKYKKVVRQTKIRRFKLKSWNDAFKVESLFFQPIRTIILVAYTHTRTQTNEQKLYHNFIPFVLNLIINSRKHDHQVEQIETAVTIVGNAKQPYTMEQILLTTSSSRRESTRKPAGSGAT